MNWILIILFVALLLALKNILIKEFLNHEHTHKVLFWICSLVCLGTLFFYKKITFVQPPEMMFFIILKSIIFAVSGYCFLHVMRKMELSSVIPLTNLSPFFLLVLSFFILGEKLTIVQYIGIAVLLFGGYALELHSFKHLFGPFKLVKDKNFLYIFATLIFASIMGVLDKFALGSIDPYSYLFYTQLFMALIFLGVIMHKGYIRELFVPLQKHYLLIFFIALLFLASDIIYFKVVALPLVPISLIIPVKRTSTLLSTLIGGKLFHESRLFHKSVCCFVMIFGVFILFL